MELNRLFQVLQEVRRLCPCQTVALSIPWMQIKHPLHPVQVAWLRGFSADEPRLESLPRWRWRMAACVGYGFYFSLRLLQARLLWLGRLLELRGQRFDLIAKSWSVGTNGSAPADDFYYGDLQERLRRQGVRMLLLRGNAQGSSWGRQGIDSGPRAGVISELCLVPLLAPFQMGLRQIRTAMRLRQEARRKAADPWVRKISARGASDCLSPRILTRTFSKWIGMRSVRLWKPKAWLTLYEGHGWEELLSRGIKEADPSCKTVGYQHTILLPHNLALLQADSQAFRPDVVLCLGERTREMLRISHPNSVLVPFGTFREMGTPENPHPERKTVLVLPEGHLDEAQLLFNAGLEAAGRLPDHRFIFRCHPVLPFERVRPHLNATPEGFPNVEISRARTIQEDFLRSSVVLYRGSSAILYAILGGLKPVYLQAARALDIDPLFELTLWKENADSPEALAQLLRQYALSDAESAFRHWRQGVKYAQSYVLPADEDSLQRFLFAVGVRASKDPTCFDRVTC